MMADEKWEDDGGEFRTGKRRKLAVEEGNDVEISYHVEGLLGSWHPGVAVGCDKVSCAVQHTDPMNGGSTAKIVEDLPVSAVIEDKSGTTVEDLPSQSSTQSSGISYGLCVDALVDGVWCEGVIFDHQESSKERRVFFPHQEDQQMIGVGRLRLTEDWDEAFGIWKPRGKWLLIQVIQDFENEGSLPVSIREIWYDLRLTSAFKDQIKIWTSGTKDIWYTLVAELIQELWSVVTGTRSEKLVSNAMIPVDVCIPMEDVHCREVPCHQADSLVACLEVSGQVDCDNRFLQLHGTGKEVGKFGVCSKALDDFISVCRNKSCSPDLRGKFHVFCHRARSHLIAAGWKLVENVQGRKHYVSPSGKRFDSLVTACEAWKKIGENWDNRTDCTGITYSQECGVQGTPSNLKYIEDKAEDISSTQAAKTWKLFKLSDAVYCPDAVELYAQNVGDRSLMSAKLDRVTLAEKVKKHLLALGWSIEFKRDTMIRFRFFSPQGKIYYSLIKVCYSLMREHQKENEEVEPEYLPYAITEYESYMDSLVQNSKQELLHADAQFLRLKAKRHLLFMGWRFWLNETESKQELCYSSPSRSTFCSLILACKAYLKEYKNFNMKPLNLVNNQKTKPELTARHGESIQDVEHTKLSTVSDAAASNKFPEPAHLEHSGAVRESTLACGSSCQAGQITVSRKSKRRVKCQSSKRETRSAKRSRMLVAPPNLHAPKTLLSWLIDNGVLLPRQKVYCICKRDGLSRKEGRLSRAGIKCMCCRTVFSLTNFAAHGGNSTEKPSSSIFLSDGRSLLQCEIQMMHSSKYKFSPHMRLKGDYSQHLSDTICSACQDGGELILCDHCPSSFHTTCIGLEDVPEGNWFCPSCKCGICGLSHYNRDVEQFTDTTVLYCDQCEREYHVGCLQLGSCPTGNWFCSNKCSDIFIHLHKLIGKPNPTSAEGLSWTLLRWRYNDNTDVRVCDPETAAHHSKLSTALDVLHECFVPIVEGRTQSDLVADIIFNNESELNRLNFWGFYTVVLEKGDELLSVATFRVFGEKVAEMPLIGTRDFCRRKGMCRLLVTELEKLLRTLGVERLVLPAVPQLLETWTRSFGFSVMSSSDRLELSSHPLLTFEGTTMCQKTL